MYAPTESPVKKPGGKGRSKSKAQGHSRPRAQKQTRTRKLKSTGTPPGPGTSLKLSPTVNDIHGAHPHDVVVAEYFAGLGFLSRWCRDIVISLDRRFRVAQFIEIDATAQMVLNHEFFGPQINENITGVRMLEPCRLALVGFPCKGTSLRGNIAGQTDAIDNDHTSMVTHFFRVLSQTVSKPQVMLLENVQGLLSAWHERKRGGFMRWLIRNLREQGYSGEWGLFSSGAEAMSGNRVFMLCRQEGVTSVRGSLLGLGKEDHGARKPNNGYGFSRIKIGDAPVKGKIACLTQSTGRPCFVFCDDDDGKYKCVEFTVDAIAALFSFNREDIVVGTADAANTKAMKMLADACRPAGGAVVNRLVANLLEVGATPVRVWPPEGAIEVQHEEGCSLPNAGFWSAVGDEIFALKGRLKSIVNHGKQSELTAAAFAAECLRNKHAFKVEQADIKSYIEKAARHTVRRRQSSLSHHLAALSLAAFPGCRILMSSQPVEIRAEGRIGCVSVRPCRSRSSRSTSPRWRPSSSALRFPRTSSPRRRSSLTRSSASR